MQSVGCKFAGNAHPAAPLKFAHPNPERFQKEEWVMEKDNMIPLELTDDELDVVAGGWSNSCGCGCAHEPALTIAAAAAVAIVL
jgi:hypothetical protein